MKATKTPIKWEFVTDKEAEKFRFALLNALNAVSRHEVMEFDCLTGKVKREDVIVWYVPNERFKMVDSGVNENVTSVNELITLYINSPPKHNRMEFPNMGVMPGQEDLLGEWLALKKFQCIGLNPFTIEAL